ncbi:MAG: transferase hexapeptide repeat containing protein [Armatimonadetes bacterium]|nr:transferase hexapeptide repeat containing protein [Armatimonadota bacterium]
MDRPGTSRFEPEQIGTQAIFSRRVDRSAGANRSHSGDFRRFLRKARYELRSLYRACRPRLWLFTSLAALVPDFAAPALRGQLYRWAGCQIQHGAALLGAIKLVGGGDVASRLVLAEGVTIAPGVTFGLDARITIGKNASVSPNVVLYTGTHGLGFGSQRMLPRVIPKEIQVEEGVWIGMHSLILPGVVLGRGCVVSAGAVVTEDVPPNALVAGNPAVVQQLLPFGDR